MESIDYLLQTFVNRTLVSNRDITVSDYYHSEEIEETEERRKFDEECSKYEQEQIYQDYSEEIEEIEKRRKFDEECSKYEQEQIYQDYSEEIEEIEEIDNLEEIFEFAERKNKYIKALKKRYENRIQSKEIYMYEVYKTLKYSLYSARIHDDVCKEYIIELKDKLENEYEIGKVYNIDPNILSSLNDELEDILESSEYFNFEDKYADPNEFDNFEDKIFNIISKYFLSKQKKYEENRSRKHTKRYERSRRYYELYNLGYKKCEIAKEMGVTPSAVTKFFKSNNIK